MNLTATVTSALNELLSRLSSRQAWMTKERLIRGGKHFADVLSAMSRGERDSSRDVSSHAERGTLHVISGRHRGASLELTERSYCLGSSEDCDVVLLDEHIAERHCLVSLGRKGFSVQDVRNEDALSISATRVTHADGAIQSEYDIGGVFIALTWHRPEHASQAGAPTHARSRSFRWTVPAVGMVAAMLVVTAVLGLHRAAEPATAEQIAELVVSANKALAGRGFDSVRFRSGAGGGLQLVGYVADLDEERRLRQWLEQEKYHGVQVSVRQVPQLLDEVRQALRDDALRVDVDGHSLRIEGTTHQPPVKDRIRSLTAELQGLVEVDDRVVYTPASAVPGPLPVRLRGVMLDEPRFIVTDAGARYFIGGVLPDGAEVVAIAIDGIRFRKDGKTLFYSLE